MEQGLNRIEIATGFSRPSPTYTLTELNAFLAEA